MSNKKQFSFLMSARARTIKYLLAQRFSKQLNERNLEKAQKLASELAQKADPAMFSLFAKTPLYGTAGTEATKNFINAIYTYFNDQIIYNELATQLQSTDPILRSAAYEVLSGDPNVSSDLLNKITNKGTKAISRAQANDLVEKTFARIDGFRKARAAETRKEKSSTSYTYKPSKKPKTQGILAIEGPEPMDEEEIADLVLYGTNQTKEDYEYSDAIPKIEEPGDVLITIDGVDFKVPELQEEAPMKFFEDSLERVVYSPSTFTPEQLDELSTQISEKFRNISANKSSVLSSEAIKSLFRVVKETTPLIQNAISGREEGLKMLNGAIVDFRLNRPSEGLIKLSRLTLALSSNLKEVNDKLIDTVKQTNGQLQLAMDERTKYSNEAFTKSTMAIELAGQIEELGLKTGELERTNLEKEAEIKQLREALSKKDAEIKKCAEEHKKQANMIKTIQDADLEKSAKMNERSLEVAKSVQENLKEDYYKLLSEHASLRLLLQRVEQERDENRLELDRFKSQVQTAAGTSSTIAVALNTLISRLSIAEQSLKTKEKTQKALTDQYTGVVELKETRIKTLETENNELNERIRNLRSTAIEADNLKSRVVNLEGEVESLRLLQKNTQKYADDSSDEALKLRLQLNSANLELAKKKELEAKEKELIVTISSLTNVRDQYAKQAKDLIIERDKANETIANYEREKAGLQARLDQNVTLISNYEEAQRAWEEATEQAKADAAAARMELVQTRQNISELTTDLASVNTSLLHYRQMEAQINNNGALLAETQAKLDEMSRLKDQTQGKFDNLLKAYDELSQKTKANTLEYETRTKQNEKEFNEVLMKKDIEIGEKENRISKLTKELEQAQLLLQTAQTNNHLDEVVDVHMGQSILPVPAINAVIDESVCLAGRRPPRHVSFDVPEPEGTAAIIPRKEKKEIRRRSALRASSAAVSKKARVGKKIIHAVPVKKALTTGGRARNVTKGGYVVGGRPDPYISPKGAAFWSNLYKSKYHLF